MFMFIKSGAFNGVAKLVVLTGCNLGFAILLSVIEIVGYLLAVLMTTYCVLKIRQQYNEDPRQQQPND